MRKSLGRVTVFSVLFLTLAMGIFLVAAWSVDDAINYKPSLKVGIFPVAEVTALSYIVFDVESGTEIASKNSTDVLPIASLTKLISAASFYDSADEQSTTTITWSDVNTDGDAGRLRPYEVYSYRELLFPLLLESSNDAAATILRVSPDVLTHMQEFVQSLGATHTVFADTSGLSSGNKSTAYELSLISQKVYKEYPQVIDITRLKQFLGTNTGWLNNNPLVTEQGYRGGKHGFTYEANRTDISFFEEHLSGGQTRIIGYVVLGTDNIKRDVDVLREMVQQNVRFE